MFYVYILRSINFPDKTYVGYTLNVHERLKTHNAGSSIYTAASRPCCARRSYFSEGGGIGNVFNFS